MGTTLTLAVNAGNSLYVASVGDSRAYRWRNGTLTLLTHDDSVVQELVDQGQLTPEAAECHPHSNVITRALGSEDALDSLDVQSSGLLPGDIVIVVCDGVWRGGHSDIEEMCRNLAEQPFTSVSLDAAAQSLVEKALLRGSDDNVSCGLLWAAPEESKDSIAVSSAGDGPAADQEEEDKSWHTENAPNATPPMGKAPTSARPAATT